MPNPTWFYVMCMLATAVSAVSIVLHAARMGYI